MTYLIFGAAGQDGMIALQLLRERGEEVHAAVRSKPAPGHPFWAARGDSRVHIVDVTVPSSIQMALDAAEPTRILNLAGFSDVRRSWDEPGKTLLVNTIGALNVFQAVQESGRSDAVRIYQASSSEVFGRPAVGPQNELAPLAPITPYGASKAAAQNLAGIYREKFGLWVATGILYNHESSYRSEDYVVRHVVASVVRMKFGRQEVMEIGDLDARRDWGYAPDYVDGMLRIIEHTEPDDFVLGTGISHSVRHLVNVAFEAADIPVEFRRIQATTNRTRTVDPGNLVGDASKAFSILGWKPSLQFDAMVFHLVEMELRQNPGS